MASRAPLALSVGDPAGVGPDVAVRAAREAPGELVLFGDGDQLATLARTHGLRVVSLDRDGALEVPPDAAGIVDVGRVSKGALVAHKPTHEGGRAQREALDAAIGAVQSGRARGLVTGPTAKEAIALSGTPFVGQTEHLARAAGLRDDDVTMMFLGRLKVSLVTTHLSVRAVPDAITEARVVRATVHLGEALAKLHEPGAPTPRMVIAGLNPHCGEGGLFGDEELCVIEPALAKARGRSPFAVGRVALLGLRPAETALREAASGALDGVVTMMHDQATIASKIVDWGNAVNVTWGLPFVRTSVDHGVAYDAARSGTADAAGMLAAVRMAQRLTREAP